MRNTLFQEEQIQESKDALSDILRMSEDSANAVKVAKQSVKVGKEANCSSEKPKGFAETAKCERPESIRHQNLFLDCKGLQPKL